MRERLHIHRQNIQTHTNIGSHTHKQNSLSRFQYHENKKKITILISHSLKIFLSDEYVMRETQGHGHYHIYIYVYIGFIRTEFPYSSDLVL